MIREGSILFRIQHLQKRGSGIALVVGAKFVDFVEDYYGVHCLGLCYRLYYPSGHCAYVGLSVSSYFSLVAYPAERNSRVGAVNGFGYGSSHRGLAYSGRSHKADYLTLYVRVKGANRNCLKNALFYLFKSVVILIQLFFRLGDIYFFVGFFVPREIENRVKIISYNAVIL